ncbi:MAG TPA: MFS transporter [Legionellaceae bacterium]|nr:MFS transporter [Legionellaceae bacterium]
MTFSVSKKAILTGISGTALQWYDFALFGYFAPIIALTFFPKDNPVSAMLSAFGVFAVGYLLAPIGSVVFGHIGDHYGRKRALSLSILGMAIPSAMIGMLPGYQSIGLLAPILVTLLRITQGFVAGSEFTGSAIFLVEHAKPGQKAFYGSLTSSAYSIGVLFAGLAASLLTASFMPAWGWRLGFAIALIAGIIIFYLRLYVSETPTYQKIHSVDKPKLPILAAIKEAPFAFIGVIGLAWLIGIMTYGTYVFSTGYLHTYFNLSLNTATVIVTLSLAVDALLEPFMAMLADRIGHLRVITIGVVLMLLLSFPVFYLLASGHMVWITIGMVLMSILIATAFAPINAYMIELFPETCRYSGFGVAFHIGISLFGGTTPLVLMWLVKQTDNLMAPAYYYIWGTLVCLSSLVICEYGRNKMADLSMKSDSIA